MRKVLEQSAEDRQDGTVVLPFQVWRDSFIGDADLGFARSTYARLRPHPYRTLTDPADMANWDKVTAPRSYLNSFEDNGITESGGRHPRLSARLGMFRLVQMPGSHEVLLTNPDLTARKIIEAGRD